MGKPITIDKKTGPMIKTIILPTYASDSARIYVQTLVDQARRCKADPRDALINTDAYPALMKRSMVEFAVGWLHGCAEAYDLRPDQLFDAALSPSMKQKIDELKRAWGITTKRTSKARAA